MANIITAFRILLGLTLVWCPTFSIWFYVLYVLGGISDVLDGIVARHFSKETEFGAQLDTLADMVFVPVVLVKVLSAIVFPKWVIVWTILIAFMKCGNLVCGFVLRKRFVSLHTVPNRICGVLVFAVPLFIDCLPWSMAMALMALTCIVATIAAIHEGQCIRIGSRFSRGEADF